MEEVFCSQSVLPQTLNVSEHRLDHDFGLLLPPGRSFPLRAGGCGSGSGRPLKSEINLTQPATLVGVLQYRPLLRGEKPDEIHQFPTRPIPWHVCRDTLNNNKGVKTRPFQFLGNKNLRNWQKTYFF